MLGKYYQSSHAVDCKALSLLLKNHLPGTKEDSSLLDCGGGIARQGQVCREFFKNITILDCSDTVRDQWAVNHFEDVVKHFIPADIKGYEFTADDAYDCVLMTYVAMYIDDASLIKFLTKAAEVT